MKALILSFALMSSTAFAIPETNYEQQYAQTVKPFLQTGKTFTFKSHDGLNLSGASFLRPDSKGTIVLVNGRSETWLKYGETFYDLYQQGYSALSYDHRGQGASPRLTDGNPQIGYFGEFQDYVLDLKSFVETVALPLQKTSSSKLFVLSHSLGGLIFTDYLSKHESPFAASVLSAPLFEMYTRPVSEDTVLVNATAAIAEGKGSSYYQGRGDYNPAAPFAPNPLTSSEARFIQQAKIWKESPETIVAGQSNNWMSQIITAERKLMTTADKVNVPTLLLQAGADRIAEAARQDEYCALSATCEKLVYPTSRHHFFLEADEIRESVLSETVKFFEKN